MEVVVEEHDLNQVDNKKSSFTKISLYLLINGYI